jgi:hypothetical protein
MSKPEERALARLLADGSSGGALRAWKRLIKDLSAAEDVERKEASDLWHATDPDKRHLLPQTGPIGRAFYELRDATIADGWGIVGGVEQIHTITPRPPVKAGLRPGHAVDDWLDKYYGKPEPVSMETK